MSFDYSQEAINDLEKLLTTEKAYDVIIYTGENENMKEFHAHSGILCARSQYFCAAFSEESVENRDGKFIFKKPNIFPQSFKTILRFFYCGKIDLTNLQGPEILKLLMAVDELDIQPLIACIQKYLIKHRHEFLQQNPIEILEIVYQRNLFKNLWNYCLEKICQEPKTLFDSNKFTDLKAPLLKLILNRGDLNLDEIIIWNGLLKWGLAQNPSISQDVTRWSNEEIATMKRTIHEFVPLVRFHYISSDDYLDKVFPLKKLLPEDLVDNLTIFYLAPNREPDVNYIQPPRLSKCIYASNLVKNQHFDIFSSWIEKKNDVHYSVNNTSPYYFHLIYRASKHGNANSKFHEKCDNKGATIVIAKMAHSEQIVGGYNPLYWDSSPVSFDTKDSFMYTFTNRSNLQTAKVGYSYGKETSIRSMGVWGPTFGCGDLRKDRSDNDSIWDSEQSESSDYPKLDLPGCFNVDDYEVFQVLEK